MLFFETLLTPDFVCTAALVAPTVLLTAPGCFDPITEAPETAPSDFDGGERPVAPRPVYAGDPARTLVGHMLAHAYVNTPSVEGGRLSVVRINRTSASLALGPRLAPVQLFDGQVFPPAAGTVLGYGPDAVNETSAGVLAWSGVRALKAAPLTADELGVTSTGAGGRTNTGRCGYPISGGTLKANRPAVVDPVTGSDGYVALCGNLGDLGAPLLLWDARPPGSGQEGGAPSGGGYGNWSTPGAALFGSGATTAGGGGSWKVAGVMVTADVLSPCAVGQAVFTSTAYRAVWIDAAVQRLAGGGGAPYDPPVCPTATPSRTSPPSASPTPPPSATPSVSASPAPPPPPGPKPFPYWAVITAVLGSGLLYAGYRGWVTRQRSRPDRSARPLDTVALDALPKPVGGTPGAAAADVSSLSSSSAEGDAGAGGGDATATAAAAAVAAAAAALEAARVARAREGALASTAPDRPKYRGDVGVVSWLHAARRPPMRTAASCDVDISGGGGPAPATAAAGQRRSRPTSATATMSRRQLPLSGRRLSASGRVAPATSSTDDDGGDGPPGAATAPTEREDGDSISSDDNSDCHHRRQDSAVVIGDDDSSDGCGSGSQWSGGSSDGGSSSRDYDGDYDGDPLGAAVSNRGFDDGGGGGSAAAPADEVWSVPVDDRYPAPAVPLTLSLPLPLTTAPPAGDAAAMHGDGSGGDAALRITGGGGALLALGGRTPTAAGRGGLVIPTFTVVGSTSQSSSSAGGGDGSDGSLTGRTQTLPSMQHQHQHLFGGRPVAAGELLPGLVEGDDGDAAGSFNAVAGRDGALVYRPAPAPPPQQRRPPLWSPPPVSSDATPAAARTASRLVLRSATADEYDLGDGDGGGGAQATTSSRSRTPRPRLGRPPPYQRPPRPQPLHAMPPPPPPLQVPGSADDGADDGADSVELAGAGGGFGWSEVP